MALRAHISNVLSTVSERALLAGAVSLLVLGALIAVIVLLIERGHVPVTIGGPASFMLRVPTLGDGAQATACVGAVECRDAETVGGSVGQCTLGILPCDGGERVAFTQEGAHDVILASNGYRITEERVGPVQAHGVGTGEEDNSGGTGLRLLPVGEKGEVAVWASVGFNAPAVRREDTRGAGGVGGAWLTYNAATRQIEWSPWPSRAKAPPAALLRRVQLPLPDETT